MIKTTPSPQIQLLPEHLIDQIKAGEIIERPSTLLKEILENSIDAGATEINVHIVNNGLDLITLKDNGIGISFENLPYAFCRHATSKINRFEDLFSLYTYGFRGEALASIASISKVTCLSFPQENPSNGGKISFHGGVQESLIEQSSEKCGTALFIKDLFYNTPVRLKFIKGKQSEKNALKKVIYSFCLAHPHVKFSIKWDEKDKEIYPATDIESRIRKLFGDEDWKEFQGDYDNHSVFGFYSGELGKKSLGRQQFIFANNRAINEKSVHSILLRNLEDHWGIGKQGHYIIFIKAPPEAIDVNVHPNKVQVKFQHAPLVNKIIKGALDRSMESHHGVQETPLDLDVFDQSEEQLENPKLNTQNISIGSRYLISPYLSEAFLIDRYQLCLLYLEQLNVGNLTDEDRTPLLVSEPFEKFSGQSDTFIAWAWSIGFELENLEDSLILRSIPHTLERFEIRPIVDALIQFAIDRDVFDGQTWNQFLKLFVHICSASPLNEETIVSMLGQWDRQELARKNATQLLTEKSVFQWMQSSLFLEQQQPERPL